MGKMDEYHTQEFNQNYENAEIILTLLFAFIDFITIIFSLLNLKSKTKNIYILRYKLFALIIIDIILRILYAMKFHKEHRLYKECIFSFLNTTQFYLILSFLEESYYDTKITKKGKFFKQDSKKKLCIIFSIVTFSYEKFTSSQKEVCLIKSFIILYCTYFLYIRLKNKIIKIVENIMIKTTFKDRRIFFCILGSPLPCMMFFIGYDALKIIFLSLENQNMIIYANIILKIIKDSSKYFLFFILNLLLYAVSGVKIEKDKLTDDFVENNKVKVKQ
jgi:hypothetical protein